MSIPAERGKRFVKVKDSSGNEWLCPLEALKSAKKATQEELDDWGTVSELLTYPEQDSSKVKCRLGGR